MGEICSVDGCDTPKVSWSANCPYCRKHYERARKHGDPNFSMQDRTPIQERWKSRYVIDPTTGCWNWTGTISRGYGYIRGNSVNYMAHRVAWESASGRPIAAGHEIDHLCRNKSCVNPDHLDEVTHTVNMERIPKKPQITHCKHGHKFTPKNTAVCRSKGRDIRRCVTCHRVNVREAQRRYRARQKAQS